MANAYSKLNAEDTLNELEIAKKRNENAGEGHFSDKTGTSWANAASDMFIAAHKM